MNFFFLTPPFCDKTELIGSQSTRAGGERNGSDIQSAHSGVNASLSGQLGGECVCVCTMQTEPCTGEANQQHSVV